MSKANYFDKHDLISENFIPNFQLLTWGGRGYGKCDAQIRKIPPAIIVATIYSIHKYIILELL